MVFKSRTNRGESFFVCKVLKALLAPGNYDGSGIDLVDLGIGLVLISQCCICCPSYIWEKLIMFPFVLVNIKSFLRT